MIHPSQTSEFKQTVCFQNPSRKHAVGCALAAVLLRAARCGSADFAPGLCNEALALISGSCCWPTRGWFDEKALRLRMSGVWPLPHQTKVHRPGSLPIFQSADLYQHHLRILLWTQGFLSRDTDVTGIYPTCVVFFLRLFVPLFPRTRYQYYLQVKKDVLEGRLRCTLEQVIRLAGLAVQGKRPG